MQIRPIPSLVLTVALLASGCGKVATSNGLEPKVSMRRIANTGLVPVVVKKPTSGTTTPPSAAPTAAPAPEPTPVAQLEPGKTIVLAGMVYGADGAGLTGVSVRARSLTAEAPFDAEVKTDTGAYVINGVPAGAAIEIVASKPGWVSRRRVGAFSDQRGTNNALDFGGSDAGRAYYLSANPEIALTSPADGSANVANGQVQLTLTLSEPLDAENRARFAKAVRLLPASDAANGGAAGTTTDLRAGEDLGYPRVVTVDGAAAVAPYAVSAGSIFLEDAANAASVTWDAAGRVATLRFAAPLLASSADTAAYQLALVSGGADQRIRDLDGRQLGTDATGSADAYPPAGDLVLGAFKAPQLVDVPVIGLAGAAARWASTHDDVVRFTLAPDEDTPMLIGARAMTIGRDTRIALTFDQPMAAFAGGVGAFVAPTLGDDATDLANYTFAVGRTRDEAAGASLDGSAAIDVDPQAVTAFGDESQRGKEFRFAAGAFAATRAAAAPGQVVVALDERDARKVWLTIAERPYFFGEAAGAIAARVVAVADPAGNAIGSGAADSHVAIGEL